ncbi:MAG TPA: histidine kinase [Geomonas sp.]|nr:histidine kinase [Geomonas sp.]
MPETGNQPNLQKRGLPLEREIGETAVKLLPGEFYATADGTVIATILGSCVSVCLFDPATGVGGMNHYMLPQLQQGTSSHCSGNCRGAACTRYGSCAMRRLLHDLEQLGAKTVRLEAKLFGAARVMAGMSDIGKQNAAFAIDYLAERGIPVTASDLGGCWPRKVVFYPSSGKVLVKRLQRLPVEDERSGRGDEKR